MISYIMENNNNNNSYSIVIVFDSGVNSPFKAKFNVRRTKADIGMDLIEGINIPRKRRSRGVKRERGKRAALEKTASVASAPTKRTVEFIVPANVAREDFFMNRFREKLATKKALKNKG